MPQTIDPFPRSEPTPNRVRWTRAQCEELQAAGILIGRYELVDGEVISKMGQNPPHGVALTYLMTCLVDRFGGLHVRMRTTIDIGAVDPAHNDPEPDAAVTIQSASAYGSRYPGADDLLLVVEVAGTTLRLDRTAKAALYALAGIPEYWIVDLNGGQLLVHRQPVGNRYRQIAAYGREESVSPAGRPEVVVRVRDLFP